MLPTQALFTEGYANARQKFIAACVLRELTPQSHRHPLPGFDGDALFTDVVRIGPTNAARVLVLTSGVHGVELFAGSGCQVDWLLTHEATQLPPDTAVVLVHAINPWGSSWLRRYTEDNIDLCRNFVDYPNMPQLPTPADYPALHATLMVDPADAVSIAAADATLAAYEKKHGNQALYGALMSGQYSHPTGMGYGGVEPTWSRRTIEAVLREHCATAREVVLMDYHTGLGPYAYGSAVALQQGEALRRIRQVFGPWVEAVMEHGAPENFAPVYGHSTPGYERALPHARVTAAVLEYGTGRPQHMLDLLVRDQREWRGGEGRHERLATRQALLRFFYPDDAVWKQAVVDQSRLYIAQALRYLASADWQ